MTLYAFTSTQPKTKDTLFENTLKENFRNLRISALVEGLALGGKLVAASLSGLSTAAMLVQFLDVAPGIIPPFFLALLWIACSGGCYCIAGIIANLLTFFRR